MQEIPPGIQSVCLAPKANPRSKQHNWIAHAWSSTQIRRLVEYSRDGGHAACKELDLETAAAKVQDWPFPVSALTIIEAFFLHLYAELSLTLSSCHEGQQCLLLCTCLALASQHVSNTEGWHWQGISA